MDIDDIYRFLWESQRVEREDLIRPTLICVTTWVLMEMIISSWWSNSKGSMKLICRHIIGISTTVRKVLILGR